MDGAQGRPAAQGPVVVTCEHASHLTPPGLFVAPEEILRSHRGWDQGAYEVARALASDIDAPLIAARWSRLLIDCNRSLDNPDLIPSTSWGEPIPGNQGLSKAERQHRVAWSWSPFRTSAQAHVRHAIERCGSCLHLSVHSFTGALGPGRDFDVGLLFDPSRPSEVRIAQVLRDALAGRGFDTRDNEPYLGIDDGHTTALRRLYPDSSYAGIEVEMHRERVALSGRRAEIAQVIAQAVRGLHVPA